MFKTKKPSKVAGGQVWDRQKGFTLIEILVAILIIGTITMAIIVYISGSVKKTRGIREGCKN